MYNHRYRRKTDEELEQLNYTDFTKTEVQMLIAETVLSDLDRRIALLKYTEEKTLEDIAFECQVDVKTVAKHLTDISKRIKATIPRIYK